MTVPNASIRPATGRIDRRTHDGLAIVGWYVVDREREKVSDVMPERVAAEMERRSLLVASTDPASCYFLRPVMGRDAR